MARYDYKCTACGNVFEVEHAMTEHPEVSCPVCGAPAQKVFSASGIVFEGHGFYNTDQRDAGKAGGTSKAAGKGEARHAASDKGANAASSESKKEAPAASGSGDGASKATSSPVSSGGAADKKA